MLKKLSFTIFSLLFTLACIAQGSIAGVIKDAASGEPIIGANVSIKGSLIGATTDIDGSYSIPNLPEGVYTLEVTYITYKTHIIPNVKVETAKKITVDIDLKEDVSELKEVEVTGTRRTDTDFEMVKLIRESKMITVGVTAEQIGKTLDRDAAQVLRRVPGITIRGDQFVQIRGLSERYNAVMLHNAYAPSVETDVRSFSFATLPSSQLDKMVVYKSPAADIPGDFAGGVVKVFTKSIPDENSFIIDYSTQVRLGTTFTDFYHQPYNSGHFTGFNTGYYSLPSTFPASLAGASDATLLSAGQSLKNLWGKEKSVATPDQRIALTSSRKFKIGKMSVGNITAVTYSNSFATYNIERNDFNTYNQDLKQSAIIYHFDNKQYNQQIRVGMLFNWAFKLDDNNLIEFKNLYNQSSNDQFTDRDAIVFESGSLQKNGAFDKVYRGIYSGQLLGTHALFDKQTSIEWMASYNNSNRNQPDYKRYRTDIDPDSKIAQLYIQNGVSPDYMGRFYSNMKEKGYSAGLSVKQQFRSKGDPLLSPELKAGVFFEGKDRDFTSRNLGFVRATYQFDPNLLYKSISEIFDPQNINNTTGIQIGERSNPNDNYTASNMLMAYYLMASVPIGKKIKIDAGVRVEDNVQKLNSFFFDGAPAIVKYPITKLLPSANVSYNFNEKMLIRAAYGQTLNRPEFRELAPFSFFDFNTNFTNKGNPYLKIAQIQDFDLRWEFYPNKGEMITFGGFYKSFKDPIETIIDLGAGGSLGSKSFSYHNAESAQGYGLEIELKKSLTGLTNSKILDRINLVFNAAAIKSKIKLGDELAIGQSNERPLQGQAPYIVNTAIFYNDVERGLQINLLYNIVGKNIVFVGFQNYPDLYQMPRNVLDFTFSKRIGKIFTIKGGISDIINQPFLILQDGNQDGKFDRKNDQVIQKFKPGQVISLGFSVKL